jgi:hypothetical protein
MRQIYLARIARMLAFLIAVTLTAGTAMAGAHEPYGWWDDPALTTGTAMAGAPKRHGWWDNPAVGYAAPIQAVFQFPAVIANQPGSGVSFLWSDPSSGLLGGQAYLYHP